MVEAPTQGAVAGHMTRAVDMTAVADMMAAVDMMAVAGMVAEGEYGLT